MAAEKGNQYAKGNDGGRPLKFESVEELQAKIDAYFTSCDPQVIDTTEWVEARDKDGKLKKDEHGLNYLVEVSHKVKTQQQDYTITDLAIALDTTRRTLIDYENRNDEFSHTIKRAKQKIESYWEKKLALPSPTGTIFNLKNNFDWKDKTENEISNPDGSLNPFSKLSEEELKTLAKGK